MAPSLYLPSTVTFLGDSELLVKQLSLFFSGKNASKVKELRAGDFSSCYLDVTQMRIAGCRDLIPAGICS